MSEHLNHEFNMGSEQGLDTEPEHEGEHYLNLLGIGHLADDEVITGDGRTIQLRDFLEEEKCREKALPVLMALEAMDPNDPGFKPTVAAVRMAIGQYIGVDPSSE